MGKDYDNEETEKPMKKMKPMAKPMTKPMMAVKKPSKGFGKKK